MPELKKGHASVNATIMRHRTLYGKTVREQWVIKTDGKGGVEYSLRAHPEEGSKALFVFESVEPISVPSEVKERARNAIGGLDLS